MPKYEIVFSDDAVEDVVESYEWGVTTWGEEAAEKWLRELHAAVYGRLQTQPKSCALAPEAEAVACEVRQLLFLRYRIVFLLEKKLVTILWIDGAYRG